MNLGQYAHPVGHHGCFRGAFRRFNRRIADEILGFDGSAQEADYNLGCCAFGLGLMQQVRQRVNRASNCHHSG